VGGLDRVEQILRITGYVASAPGFVQQSQVMNGASEVFGAHIGSRGRHARTSVGVAELPRGAPVEIDIVAAIRAG
jgi:enamine deaminase RidA (YjgF/YER057c/UK114 family)